MHLLRSQHVGGQVEVKKSQLEQTVADQAQKLQQLAIENRYNKR